MANSINRRNWIRSSAFMAGGLALCSGTINKLSAMPKRMLKSPHALTDREVAAAAPLELKARLLANENPFGPSPAAKKAIADALDKSYQYPFALGSQLKGNIAKYEGMATKNIIIDSGSTPLLHAAAI